MLVGILLTGALVGAAVAIPLFQTASQGIDEVTEVSAKARAAAFSYRMQAYESVALQFTSRSEIRKRLARYLEGEWSLTELVHFNEPRLGDALAQSEVAHGLIRFARDQEVTARIGITAHPNRIVPNFSLPAGHTDTQVMVVADIPMLLVQAPIYEQGDRLLGVDVVFFCLDDIAEMLADEGMFGANSDQWLIYWPDKLLLGAEPETGFQQLSLLATKPAIPQEQEDITTGLLPTALRIDGQVRFYAPLKEDWGLVVALPEHSLYQPAYYELAWAVLAVLMLMLLGAMFTGRTIGPLVRQLDEKNTVLHDQAAELKLAASVFEGTQEPILITDLNQIILRANHAFTRLTGYSAKQAMGCSLADFLTQTDKDLQPAEQVEQINRHLVGHDSWQGELYYARKDQTPMPALQTVSVVKDDDNRPVRLIHIFNDITQEKAARLHMKHQAEHDALTGLANRVALVDRLEQLLEEQTPVAVLFVDLDRFKEINDNFGHQVGDQLLQEVAQRLRERLRETDVAGRLGGDEFVVLLEGQNAEESATIVANDLIESLTEEIVIEQNHYQVGCSIGIALYPQDAEDADTLLQFADKAMYASKEAGGNCYHLHQSE